MTLERYLQHRRRWEVSIVLGVVVLSFVANFGIVWMELAESSVIHPARYAAILEGTSALTLGCLVPLVFWFDRRVPLRAERWKTALAAHAGMSVVFSLLHVVAMYALRVPAFAMAGSRYHWDNWAGQLFYEYLKDFRTYLLILALLYLYRFVLRRLQGEAGFVSEGRDDSSQQPVTDRFLVKKLGREFLVRLEDIDWIESSGNYVNLHVGKQIYPLRSTMSGITERLSAHGFQRVHRTAIVNLDRVAEIVAFETGDGEARLQSDTTVPVSRRFRKELRERLT